MNVSSNIKLDMLNIIATAIDPVTIGQNNYFFFTDVSGNLLAKMAFDEVQSSSTPNVELTFLKNGSSLLEGVVELDGRATNFYIPDKASVSTVVLSGTVGTPASNDTDIVFNRTDWIKKNGISLANVTIRMESVCLQQ
jgi:hypothetical protein